MRLAIHQPYFMPYLGYFDLINQSDKWVVFDTAQYVSRSWMNRNRVLHPDVSKGDLFITVPVKKHAVDTPINHIEINYNTDWRSKIRGQLSHYKHAPYYHHVIALLEECFSFNFRKLSSFNLYCLDVVCRHIGVYFNYTVFSEEYIPIEEPKENDEWALNISKALGASEYINAPGGEGTVFKDPDKFKRQGIDLTFRRIPMLEYQCGKFNYIPGLSILDVMMWNSKQQIIDYLDSV